MPACQPVANLPYDIHTRHKKCSHPNPATLPCTTTTTIPSPSPMSKMQQAGRSRRTVSQKNPAAAAAGAGSRTCRAWSFPFSSSFSLQPQLTLARINKSSCPSGQVRHDIRLPATRPRCFSGSRTYILSRPVIGVKTSLSLLDS